MTLIYNILNSSESSSESSSEDLSGNTASSQLYDFLKRSDSAQPTGGLGKSFSRGKKRKALVTNAFTIVDLPGDKGTVVVKDVAALEKLANAFEIGDIGINANQKKQAICLALLIVNEKTQSDLRTKSVEKLEKIYQSDAFKKESNKDDILQELANQKSLMSASSSMPAAEQLTNTTHVRQRSRSGSDSKRDNSPTSAGQEAEQDQARRDSTYAINFSFTGAGGKTEDLKPEGDTPHADDTSSGNPSSIVNLTGATLGVISTPARPGSSATSSSPVISSPSLSSSVAGTSDSPRKASGSSTPVAAVSSSPSLSSSSTASSTLSSIPSSTTSATSSLTSHPDPLNLTSSSALSSTSSSSSYAPSSASSSVPSSSLSSDPSLSTSSTTSSASSSVPSSDSSLAPSSTSTSASSSAPSLTSSLSSATSSSTRKRRTPASGSAASSTHKSLRAAAAAASSDPSSSTYSSLSSLEAKKTPSLPSSLAPSSLHSEPSSSTSSTTSGSSARKEKVAASQSVPRYTTVEEIMNSSAVKTALDTMSKIKTDDIKSTKGAQEANFSNAIKQMTEEQLLALNNHLNQVQHGYNVDARFETIRKERKFIGHGNTATWEQIRHAVKSELFSRAELDTGGPLLPGEKRKIPAAKYYWDYNMYNQHSGRFFTHIGRTNTAKKFAASFEPDHSETPSTRKKR